MAIIKAFKAMRFDTSKAGKIEELTCPPYDVISPAQRENYINTNKNNIIRLELPTGENPYKDAASLLDKWLSDGILKKDTNEAIYIYEEEFEAYGERKKFKGIISRVKLTPFSEGVVLPHENTLSKAKEDRFNLMKTTGCNFSQVYSLYIDEEHTTEAKLDLLTKDAPNVQFDDGSVIHRLWIINDKVVIKSICDDFASRQLYIADGHHRYETALNYKNYCYENNLTNGSDDCDYIMMMLVDMANPGLVVFPTHRLVRDLPVFDANAVVEGCKEYFDITHQTGVDSIEKKLTDLYNEGKHAFGFYCQGDEWKLMVLKDESVLAELMPEKSKALRELDVSILHTLVLEKIMGIDAENMAKQINLYYTRSFDEALSEVRCGNAQCTFILNPTRVGEISQVATNGEKMPQKSTYFYPKLITGLVMNKLM